MADITCFLYNGPSPWTLSCFLLNVAQAPSSSRDVSKETSLLTELGHLLLSGPCASALGNTGHISHVLFILVTPWFVDRYLSHLKVSPEGRATMKKWMNENVPSMLQISSQSFSSLQSHSWPLSKLSCYSPIFHFLLLSYFVLLACLSLPEKIFPAHCVGPATQWVLKTFVK